MSYQYDVFLGGSCGASSWRQDAIGHLEGLGLTFFNPQKEFWEEDMVKVERHAKEHSRILLFVVDYRQRSLVTLIEIVYLAALRAPLVVVLPDEYRFPGSPCEYKERLRTMQFVRRVLHYERIPICASLPEALGLIESILLKNKSMQEVVCRPKWMFVFLKCFILFVGRVCSLPVNLLFFMALHTFLDETGRIHMEYLLRYRYPSFILACRIVKYLLLSVCLCRYPMIFLLLFSCSLTLLYVVFPGLKKLRSIKLSTPTSMSASCCGPGRSACLYDIYVGGTEAMALKTNSIHLGLKKAGFSFTFSNDCAIQRRFDSICSSWCVFYAFSCADNFLEQFVELAYSMGIGAFVVANFDTTTDMRKDWLTNGALEHESAIRSYRRAIFYLRDMSASTVANFFENDLNGAVDCLLRRIATSGVPCSRKGCWETLKDPPF